jgi:rod shape-determining protein MreB
MSMRAFNKLVSRYSSLFYVQIWEEKLKMTESATGRSIEEAPLVAIRTEEDGKKIIDAVGNNAKLAAGPKISVINPFSHPRLLFSDFTVGEKLLTYFLKEMNHGKFFALRPVVVIHPMEKTEGGLTDIERRAFQELAVGAGAREVFVHEGAEIPLHHLKKESFEYKEEMVSLPKNEKNTRSSFASFVLFALGILFVIILNIWKDT